MFTRLIGLQSIEEITTAIVLFNRHVDCTLGEGAIEIIVGKYFDPFFKKEFFSLTISYSKRGFGEFVELKNKKGITCGGGDYITKHFREIMKDFLPSGIVGYIHNNTIAVICKNNVIGSFYFTRKDIQNLLEEAADNGLLNVTIKVSKIEKYKRKLLWRAIYKKVSQFLSEKKSNE